jgi:predicted enzyme related to lactoylglutathione lyase
MPLSAFPVRASVAVSHIGRAIAFYEGQLGLKPLKSGPSADIPNGSRVYGSGGGPALNVYQSATAGQSEATLATWYVDDIDEVVEELAAVGVEFVRYDAYEHDAQGITPRAGGGRIAWFQDPDGNTFAIEADA